MTTSLLIAYGFGCVSGVVFSIGILSGIDWWLKRNEEKNGR
ncbi:hypothetical protein IAD21_00944 [Abditibacteriota bacterium]|nr:hypothetical protein IAD21_00944 [Abditibacteriota bacterium]